MLQRSTVRGLGWELHWSTGYRFLSWSEQIAWRSREPEPQLLEHWRRTGRNDQQWNEDTVTDSLWCSRLLTSPHAPTCQLICFGQADTSQGWTASGRSKVLQNASSSRAPSEPTQVTSLVCSPDPQLTEH